MIKHAYLNSEDEKPKEWYETIWGLVILTVGLNVLSNFIYEKGREQLRISDKSKQRLKDIDFLQKYEGQSLKQATKNVDEEDAKVDNQYSDSNI